MSARCRLESKKMRRQPKADRRVFWYHHASHPRLRAIPSLKRAAFSGVPTSEAGKEPAVGFCRQATVKQPKLVTRLSDGLVTIAMIGTILICVSFIMVRWWRSGRLVYRATEQCRQG